VHHAVERGRIERPVDWERLEDVRLDGRDVRVPQPPGCATKDVHIGVAERAGVSPEVNYTRGVSYLEVVGSPKPRYRRAGPRSRWIAATVLFALAVAASACSADTATQPRSEYAARVNTLCAAITTTIDGALIPVLESYIAGLDASGSDEQSLTDEQVMGLYAATRPVVENLNQEFAAMLSELRSLPQPDTDASVFAEHWDRVEALWIEGYKAIVTASSDPVAARALLAEPDPRLSPTNEAAVTLGIEQCVFD
jgi:hypothetical protein